MTTVTAIALSGGIDSLVSAAILKEQGHRIIGVHFLNGFETESMAGPENPESPDTTVVSAYAQKNIEPLAHQLDIPVHIIDLKDEFQKQVINYFVQAYAAGKTPNPCLVCNPSIKFNILFEHARSFGAERIATGHYARIKQLSDGRIALLRGIDTLKDQSYFLARLTQEQLAAAVLPLGNQTKAQTREMARELGLVPTHSSESQDVCFIKNNDYGDFIARQPGFEAKPGTIEDIHGRQIGEHQGLYRFTVGQRRGINCPAAAPYYVVRLESQRNCLVVGGKQDLLTPDCRVDGINWIVPAPRQPIQVQTRLRYRHRAVPSLLSPQGETSAEIKFATPQSAVTPGQGAVFYKDDEVLGAGWIQ